MKAQPGPMVSGRYFLPKAPLLWVKWIPDWLVMSRNWICWTEAKTGAKPGVSSNATANLKLVQKWFVSRHGFSRAETASILHAASAAADVPAEASRFLF